MNKRYYFKSYQRGGSALIYLSIVISVLLITLLFSLFLDYNNPNNIVSVILVSFIISLPASLLVFVSGCNVKVSDAELKFTKFFRTKWSEVINNIATVELITLPNNSWRTFFIKQKMSAARPRTGLKVVTLDGRELKASVYDYFIWFKSFTDNLKTINPNVKIIENQDLLAWRAKNPWSY